MATTPNFNWSTPDNTGLVKNGALDIRTLGNSIDASMADLKGGTTGQVLKKATNTDMDFVWSADSAGMTNPMTTTGDTIYSSSGSTPARLGIGTTGQVLTVAGGVPSWATPSAGGASFVGAVVYNTTDQTISNNTLTVLNFNAERTDTNGFHDNATNNSRITIPTGYGGKYLIWCLLEWAANGTGTRGVRLNINNNYPGSNSATQVVNATTTYESQNQFVFYRELSVGDYVTLQVRQTSGGNLDAGGSSNGYVNQFGVQYLGA